MFENFRARTKIKVLITNHLSTHDVKRVYDNGNGAYILSHLGDDPRYLKRDGTFVNNDFYQCNGDAVKWESHIGDINTLKFKA